MKAFISYAREDRQAKDRVVAALEEIDGLDLFYDEQTPSWESIEQVILKQLPDCACCVFLSSENSIKSPWCLLEVGAFWGAGKPVISYRPGDVEPLGNAPIVGKLARGVSSPEALRNEIYHLIEGARAESVDESSDQPTVHDAVLEVLNLVRGLDSKISASAFDESNMFGARFGHFRDEKIAIAREAIERLDQAIREYTEKGERVRLILDSGTSVYPLFDEIAQASVEKHWHDVLLVTNNIPGMLELMKRARKTKDRYAPIRFNTRVTQGHLTPVFWAVLPDEPIEDVSADMFFGEWSGPTIGVTTGNYLRRDGSVILARNRGHIRVKKLIMDEADQLYLLFPLGKVLNTDADGLNAIVSEDDQPDPDHVYSDLKIPYKNKTYLVTTARNPGDLLYHCYLYFKDQTFTDTAELVEAPYSIAEIAGRRPSNQFSVELPHFTDLPTDRAREALCRFLSIDARHRPPP